MDHLCGLRTGRDFLFDRCWIAQSAHPVAYGEIVDLQDEDGIPGRVVTDEFSGQPGTFSFTPDPRREFLRIHVGNRDDEFRKVHGFSVDGVGHGMDENAICIRDQLAGRITFEVGVHAPNPVRDTAARSDRIRSRHVACREQPHFETCGDTEHQDRCGLVPGIRRIPHDALCLT